MFLGRGAQRVAGLDEQHAAEARFAHGGQHRLAQLDGAVYLDFPVLGEARFVKALEPGVDDRQRGQVHKVCGRGLPGQQLAEGVDLVRVGQIDVERADAARMGRDQRRELVQVAAALRKDQCIRIGGQQPFDQRAADIAGRARR